MERVAHGVTTTFEATRVLREVRGTEGHKVFFDNAQFGRMLMLDHAVQVTSGDEFVYHEMMSHVPLFAHPDPQSVLIIGGGDGGLAEEVLKHRSVKHLAQVEIDPEVVQLSRVYFPAMNDSIFDDPRFSLLIADGAEFVARTDQHFDVIFVDSTDPQAASVPLFTPEFYRNARGVLNPGGVLVAQLGIPFLNLAAFASGMRNLAGVFSETSCYLVPIPSLLGGPLAFGWGSEALPATSTSLDVLRARFESQKIATRYYTPEVHAAAFALPRYLQETLVEALRAE